jgi:hypothetical protein
LISASWILFGACILIGGLAVAEYWKRRSITLGVKIKARIVGLLSLALMILLFLEEKS